MPKIVIIGGGSAIWTKNILCDICLVPALRGSEVVLVDIDQERLLTAEKLAKRIAEETASELEVTSSMNRAKSLKGADFVIIGISVGGNEEWLRDIEIPWKQFHIMQTVGDSTGPGGIFRALRHIPVMVEIAKDIKAICPDAWTIQLTNPMSTICRALEKETEIKMVGYCHGVQDTENYLADDFGLNAEQIQIYGYGVNHFLFIHSLLVDGKPGMHLLEKHKELLKEKHPSICAMWETFGLYPVNRDRHPAEFVPFFLGERNDHGNRYSLDQAATYEHMEKSLHLVQAIEAELNSEEPMQIIHSGEKIAEIMEALLTDKNLVLHLNVPNNGAVSNLPAECYIEVPTLVNSRGYHPLAMGELPRGIDSLVRRIAEEHEMIVEAALTGDKQMLIRALALDPLVYDIHVAQKLFEAFYEAQKPYLSMFS